MKKVDEVCTKRMLTDGLHDPNRHSTLDTDQILALLTDSEINKIKRSIGNVFWHVLT